MMNQSLVDVIRRFDLRPVLIDVGASGEPPRIWSSIAASSTYLGFDPDSRELQTNALGGYASSTIVNRAVVAAPGADTILVYLTRSPYCSSTLEPDLESLAEYNFRELFEVERTSEVPVTTLAAALKAAGLDRVDWFKTDSQGSDLRLFNSLPEPIRDTVLAVDIEPGLIDAYRGEDLFVDAHRDLVRQGFWLSNLDVKGTVRMRAATLPAPRQVIESNLRSSPCWCEARYLRTLDWLATHGASEREFSLLCVFAMLDGQFGFAWDAAAEQLRRFPDSQQAHVLADTTRHDLHRRLRWSLPRWALRAAGRIARRVFP